MPFSLFKFLRGGRSAVLPRRRVFPFGSSLSHRLAFPAQIHFIIFSGQKIHQFPARSARKKILQEFLFPTPKYILQSYFLPPAPKKRRAPDRTWRPLSTFPLLRFCGFMPPTSCDEVIMYKLLQILKNLVKSFFLVGEKISLKLIGQNSALPRIVFVAWPAEIMRLKNPYLTKQNPGSGCQKSLTIFINKTSLS